MKLTNITAALSLLWLASTVSSRPPGELAAAEIFRDVIAASGITFEHQSAPEKKYVLESMAGGG